jgi:PAS domain S-box-containing protein
MNTLPGSGELLAELDYRRLLDALPDAVIAADAANRVVYANGAAAALLGWPAEELVGRPLTTIVPERLRADHVAAFGRFIATHEARLVGRTTRLPALHRDGHEIEVELTLAAFHFGGQNDLIIGSLRDLRERVELERQLTIARYLRAATEIAAHLTSHLDLHVVTQSVVDKLVRDFDAALARVWIHDPAEGVLHLRASAGLSTRVAESSRARIDPTTYPYKIARVARTRRPFVRNGLSGDPEFEQDWVAQEGIAAVAVYPLLIGGELRGVLAYFSRQELPAEVVDVLVTVAAMVTTAISDVQLLEQEQAARSAAETAHERLAFLAEASALLAGSLEYETTLTRVAQLVVPRLGDWCVVDVREPDGSIRRVATVHTDPEKQALAEQLSRRYRVSPAGTVGVPRVLRTGRPEIVEAVADTELAARAQDPEHLRLLRALDLRRYLCLPLSARGRTLGAISVGTSGTNDRAYGPDDLSLAEVLARRAAMAIDNARLYQELQEAVRLRDEFLSTVSHDLKNPLSSIKAITQVNLRRIERLDIAGKERLSEGLARVNTLATKMTAMLNELLDLARLEAGRPIDLDRQIVDLVALVRQIIAELQPTSERHRLRVEAAVPRLTGRWDAVRLERVLVNLLSNAIKYSPSGGEITIGVGKSSERLLGTRNSELGTGPWAYLTVRDEGIGIPAGDLPHIFERFRRAENVTGRIAGTGIGLAAARQIVEQHGGAIAVESVEGFGTTVTIWLPLA